MLHFIKRNKNSLCCFMIGSSLLSMVLSIFLFNRTKVCNFTQDETLGHQASVLDQTIFLHDQIYVRYIHLYTKEHDKEKYPISVTFMQDEQVEKIDNIADYLYKDGSYRIPLNFKIESPKNLHIHLQGVGLDNIILSTNTLLGKFASRWYY